ncbi:MAG: family 43 glycosylhydrolase [Pontiellaceae bacterium]|nr:family 43 glycosylhydrolase [Pontiellaceae bacterium]MBN2786235.1 family 43 glycosylhydrolase [Pontiellaceae bacterium]
MFIDGKKTRMKVLGLRLVSLLFCGPVANADTVAYWRFEEGPLDNSPVSIPFGALDYSGNGNHLAPGSEGGVSGFAYRKEVALPVVARSGASNDFSIRNTGQTPSLQTRSTDQNDGSGSFPSGIDIESITPAQFTIEAYFKPGTGGYRTIVGRDGAGVVKGTSALAALYFQITPDNRVKVAYADVSGYWHQAISRAGLIRGFDAVNDPDGGTGSWYYMAAVCDGSVLSLYLANTSVDSVPYLVARAIIGSDGSPDTALTNGAGTGTDWHAGGWSVGRGLYDGNQTDRFPGFIDEVRISDVALRPDQFLCSTGNTAGTVAYWRFEEGPINGVLDKPFGAKDASGNGNHLDPWSESGNDASEYRVDTAVSSIPLTGVTNRFSARNRGTTPSLQTRSMDRSYGTGSHPAGTDIEAITPAQFTVEAFFKPESGGYRTLVGRDAYGVADSSSKLASLYFQIQPDNSVKIGFSDVSGYWHQATSAAGLIHGFDSDTDPNGLTGIWYYMAAVSDGSVMSLYLADTSIDSTPQLVARENIVEYSGSTNTALARGIINGSDWHAGGWSVGRGLYDGKHADRFSGFIDEVRISASALDRNELLFYDTSIQWNPIMYAADPHIILVSDTYWIYPTSGPGRQFFAYSSKDLIHWQTHGPVLDFNEITWNGESDPEILSSRYAWAPGVIEKNGTYYFYYSAGPKPSYIGVAVSSTPDGPFVDSGAPLLADYNDWSFEAIDPMVFSDPVSGKSFFYAGGSSGSKLRIFELNNDMISFAQEVTPASNPVNYTEGPFMHYDNGMYHLTYSHGYWNDDSYSLHYSTSSTPYGPWTYRGILMQSSDKHKGPGHHSCVYNPFLDEWYVCYHRYNNAEGAGPYSLPRSVAFEYMTYDANGLIKPFALTDSGVGPVNISNHPGIHAELSGSGVELSWPISITAYHLSSATSLVESAWSDLLVSPTQDGSNWKISIPITGSDSRFFRLSAP